MRTLDEWNNERAILHGQQAFDPPRANGIACGCGAELFDSRPFETLTTQPPKKAVLCKSCGFTGYRIA